ncbi:hypothetical protein ASG29_10760 [Sphingomonas sp. Leaf412]|uniref:hypothetical protein n=1 Tax=Sphingomonas sp. Leaf412 TaxID=1736370 RepID=UPI0006F88F60|nr:hypothetical protein [Sphingomonas sp. Leaf412]KQT32289.1 hypothetical protein ASG29_10760 [Sphingomonas sp. Leaf412]
MIEWQDLLFALAGAAIAVAIAAGWRDARRRRRDDVDAVGWVDWTTVQVLAVFVAAGAALLAWKG